MPCDVFGILKVNPYMTPSGYFRISRPEFLLRKWYNAYSSQMKLRPPPYGILTIWGIFHKYIERFDYVENSFIVTLKYTTNSITRGTLTNKQVFYYLPGIPLSGTSLAANLIRFTPCHGQSLHQVGGQVKVSTTKHQS